MGLIFVTKVAEIGFRRFLKIRSGHVSISPRFFHHLYFLLWIGIGGAEPLGYAPHRQGRHCTHRQSGCRYSLFLLLCLQPIYPAAGGHVMWTWFAWSMEGHHIFLISLLLLWQRRDIPWSVFIDPTFNCLLCKLSRQKVNEALILRFDTNFQRYI